MKTALVFLAAGFGLAHVTSFVAARSGTAPAERASYVVTGNDGAGATAAASPYLGVGPTQSAFSQYEVQIPRTMTLLSAADAYAAPTAPVQALAADGGVDQVVAPTSSLTPAHPDIASNVARGVSQMDEAMKTAPVAMARMSESVAKNGIIAALAYDDPAVKAQTNKLSAQIGDSLRNFAEAIGKDMQRSVRESGIQAQSVSGR